MNIPIKVLLASVSGVLCYLVFDRGFDGGWPQPVFYIVSGAVFAAGVLSPYLKRDKAFWYRGIGIIAVSTASYWFAIQTTLLTVDSKGFPDATSYLAASLVGAFVALTGARFISPLRSTMVLAVAGLPAAIIGGLTFSMLPDHWPDASFVLPFLIWHCLMAFSIHFAEAWKLRRGTAE